MKSSRVLAANSPPLIRELVVEATSDQPDIEVVGEIEEESGIETALDQTQPDFWIVALDSGDRLPESCQAVPQNHPKVRSSWRGHPIPTAIFLLRHVSASDAPSKDTDEIRHGRF